MEVTIKILGLTIKHIGSIRIQSTAQTASDKLNPQSHLVTLNESSQLKKGTKWPEFTYKFTKQYLQLMVTFQVFRTVDNTRNNDILVGIGCSPLILTFPIKPTATPLTKDTILTLKMNDSLVYVNVGIIRFQYSYSFDSNSQHGTETPLAPVATGKWTSLSTARQCLPLLNSAQLNSEDEETSTFLKIKEEEEKLRDGGALMPQAAPILTVVFHSFATSWEADQFMPYASLIKGEISNNTSTPQAEWYWNEADKPGGLSAGNIMKVVNFDLKSSSVEGVGMYLFAEGITGPILHVVEPIYSLAPFRFYHRGWLPNIPQPTVPSDSCVHDSIHVLTSLHLLPSQEDYEVFNGFELIVTDLSYQDVSADTMIVIGVELIRKTPHHSEIHVAGGADPKRGFIPSFFEKKGSENAGGSDNFKMTICKPDDMSTDGGHNCKAYFFFPENDTIIKGDIQNGEIPMFIFHVCIIDGPTSLPWWVTSHHYQSTLEIDSISFELLVREDMKGVRWFHSWEGGNDIHPCSFEIALRWKDNDDRFLTPQDYPEMSKLQYLPVLLHHLTLKNQQNVAHAAAENALADIMQQLHPEDTDRGNIMGTAQSKVTFTNLQLPTDTTSMLSVEEKTYRQTIQELGTVLLKVQHEKEVLEQEKSSLTNELTALKAEVDSRRAGPSRQRTGDHNRIESLERELLGQKEKEQSYLRTIRTLENKLEAQNYELDRTRLANHEQVKSLCRRLHKYRRCYETAIQQDQIISQLEMLISKLPPENELQRHDNPQHEAIATPQLNQQRSSQVQNHPQNHSRDLQTNSISESSFVSHSNVFDDEGQGIETHQLHQALAAMSEEIGRLREENGHLHSHLATIIKTLSTTTLQKNYRKQRHVDQ